MRYLLLPFVLLLFVSIPSEDRGVGSYDAEYSDVRARYPWITDELYLLIDRNTSKYHLGRYVSRPNSFVASLIHAESRGKRTAISRSGARGYMQIMPFHYKGPARHLYNSELNIKIGVRYLAYCMKLADGDKTIALKNYNSGPNSSYYNWRYIDEILVRYRRDRGRSELAWRQ